MCGTTIERIRGAFGDDALYKLTLTFTFRWRRGRCDTGTKILVLKFFISVSGYCFGVRHTWVSGSVPGFVGSSWVRLSHKMV